MARIVPLSRATRLCLLTLGGFLLNNGACSPHRAESVAPDVGAPAASCALPPRAAPEQASKPARNLAGAPLATCSTEPLTGVYRDGRCATGPDDRGVHVVCAQVTDDFLRFSKTRGNDLLTASRDFPGLRAGDRWCLCAARWSEAESAGVAPPVALDATEVAALRTIPEATLEAHALRGGNH